MDEDELGTARTWLIEGACSGPEVASETRLTCARTVIRCRLLEGPVISPAEFLGAARMFTLLARRGRGPNGLGELDGGSDATTRLLRHGARSHRVIELWALAADVAAFARMPRGQRNLAHWSGWATGDLGDLLAECMPIIQLPECGAVILEAAAAERLEVFLAACSAAAFAGVDIWPWQMQRVRTQCIPAVVYWAAQACESADRMAALIDVSDAVPKLRHLGQSLTPTQRHQYRTVAGMLVCALRRFPGAGAGLICAALESDDFGFRRFAAAALGRWPRERASPELRAALETAIQRSAGLRGRTLLERIRACADGVPRVRGRVR